MRTICLTLTLATLLPLAARAGDDDEIVVGPIAANLPEQMARMGRVEFDQWMYQNEGNAKQGEQRLQTQAKLQLAELGRVCELSDAQRSKLELAARGDLRRFLEEVDAVRRKFNAVKEDQNAMNQMWQEIQPLQAKMNRLTGSGSLFMKTVPQTLSAEQTARYEAVTEERRKFRYQASIAVALHTLEGGVALKHEQREAIQKVLLDLPPPRAFGQYEHYLIMYRLANMPPEKLQPLLDARQWTALKRQFTQYKGMRQFLIDQGLISREDLGAEPPTAGEAPQ